MPVYNQGGGGGRAGSGGENDEYALDRPYELNGPWTFEMAQQLNEMLDLLFRSQVKSVNRLTVLEDAEPAATTSTWTTVFKETSESRTSADTRAADSELFVTMAANTTYIIRSSIVASALAGGPNINYRITGPASPTLLSIVVRTMQNTIGATRKNAYDTSDVSVATNTDGDITNIEQTEFVIDAIVENGTTAGDFNFEWTSSNATWAITVHAGSYMEYHVL